MEGLFLDWSLELGTEIPDFYHECYDVELYVWEKWCRGFRSEMNICVYISPQRCMV